MHWFILINKCNNLHRHLSTQPSFPLILRNPRASRRSTTTNCPSKSTYSKTTNWCLYLNSNKFK